MVCRVHPTEFKALEMRGGQCLPVQVWNMLFFSFHFFPVGSHSQNQPWSLPIFRLWRPRPPGPKSDDKLVASQCLRTWLRPSWQFQSLRHDLKAKNGALQVPRSSSSALEPSGVHLAIGSHHYLECAWMWKIFCKLIGLQVLPNYTHFTGCSVQTCSTYTVTHSWEMPIASTPLEQCAESSAAGWNQHAAQGVAGLPAVWPQAPLANR